MSRSTLLLDLAYVLALGLLILVVSNFAKVEEFSAPASITATSTLAIEPSLSLPTVALPSLPFKASSTPPQEAPVQSKTAPTSAVPAPLAATAEETPVEKESTPLEDAAVKLRSALVNIYCIAPPSSPVHSASGSGIIIDSKGIILTNAHVASYSLLGAYGVECTIRTGSPATKSYVAKPIYLPPSWINRNADFLSIAHPVGTGEHDYALLAVTASATEKPLPASFPYISLARKAPSMGTPIAVASYGSQSLQFSQIENHLYPTVVFSTIKDIYTFSLSTIDIIELGGTAAAQQGSSGGGATNEKSELIGLITTSTTKGDITTRQLDAITASYIRADYESANDESLDLLLNRSTSETVAAFAPKIQGLASILTESL